MLFAAAPARSQQLQPGPRSPPRAGPFVAAPPAEGGKGRGRPGRGCRREGRGGGCRPHLLLSSGQKRRQSGAAASPQEDALLGTGAMPGATGRDLRKRPLTGKRFWTVSLRPRRAAAAPGAWHSPASVGGRGCPRPAPAPCPSPASSFFSIDISLQRRPEVFRDN